MLAGRKFYFSQFLVLIPAIYRLYIIEVPCLKEKSLTSEQKAYGV